MEYKAPSAVVYVEDHAALLPFKEVASNLVVLVEHGNASQIRMRVDVSWTQLLENQILVRALGTKLAEVNHYRHIGEPSRLECSIDRGRVGASVVGCLDADNNIRILLTISAVRCGFMSLTSCSTGPPPIP